MAKMTKRQKENLTMGMLGKALKLFNEGLITPNELENVRKLCTKVMKKLVTKPKF